MSASAGSYALTEAASSNPLANIEQVLLLSLIHIC